MKSKINYPSISVITPTFNSKKTIAKCLASVRNQDYPQNKIEIIIIDGGSQDNTLSLIKKYKIKLIKIDPKKQNVELNKSTGISKAKGELLFMIDHDNILPEKNVLSRMVVPFLEHKDMVGVESLHYHYDKKMTLLDRYFALFGVTDPLAYYLGKADRMSYLTDKFAQKYTPKDCGDYFLVKFKKNNIPTLGANGFLVKRATLLKHAEVSEGNYLHIDVNVDLIKKGFNTYAFVKNSISHIAGHGSVIYYLKRRMRFLKQYYLGENTVSIQKVRRYSMYERKD